MSEQHFTSQTQVKTSFLSNLMNLNQATMARAESFWVLNFWRINKGWIDGVLFGLILL